MAHLCVSRAVTALSLVLSSQPLASESSSKRLVATRSAITFSWRCLMQRRHDN